MSAFAAFLLTMLVAEASLPYRGFSGGMMLHTGYVKAPAFAGIFQGYSSLTGGVGGAARLHFGENLRLGGEGYVSTAAYDANKSYVSLSWGGLLLDYALCRKRWSWCVGCVFGGGSVQHLHRGFPLVNDFVPDAATNYRHYATMLASPYVGLEYALNDGIHLTAKIDCVMPVFNEKALVCDFPMGPRLYVGFLFYRLK